METLITVVHYMVCIFLIGVILLQAGKGADIGAAFGAGGSQTLFGPRGAATVLNKITAIVAVIFVCTSLSLVAMSRKSGHSVLEKFPVTSAPETAPSETMPAKPPLTTPETQK